MLALSHGVESEDVNANRSVEFFDHQFEQQVEQCAFALNPFEQTALPYLSGHVLDFGCGLGNLAIAAARAGCSVVALDASEVAIRHLRQVAATENLRIDAQRADLGRYRLTGHFDSIAAIGLLMFFDCATAARLLADLQASLRPGGTMVVNVLVEGTTYMDMFDKGHHCLFARDELLRQLAHWELIASEFKNFAAPGDTVKSFQTVIARKPLGQA